MKIRLLLLLMLAALPLEAVTWKYIGPGSLVIRQIVPDRRNPDLWFATVERDPAHSLSSALFRSTDRGHTWLRTQFVAEVRQVFVHPVNSNVFVVTARQQLPYRAYLWMSCDGAKTFYRIGILGEDSSDWLVPDSSNPDTLYRIGTLPLVSHDDGRHWVKLGSLPMNWGGCRVRNWYYNDILPMDRVLYASVQASRYPCPGKATSLNLLIESRDSGRNWEVLQSIPPGDPFVLGSLDFLPTFHYDPAFPERAFLFGNSGLWRLSSGKWNRMSKQSMTFLSSIPRHPEKLIALQDRSVEGQRMLRSSDGGGTWTDETADLNNSISVIAAQDQREEALLAGTRAGLYRGGFNRVWEPSNRGLLRGTSPSLIGVAGAGRRLYAGGYREVYRRSGSGKSWQNLLQEFVLVPNESIRLIQSSPVNPDHVILLLVPDFASGNVRFLVSRDGGNSWKESSVSWDVRVCRYANAQFDSVDPDIVYLWCGSSVYKSNDGGLTAQLLPLTLYDPRILVDPHNNLVVYFVSDGIFKSTDGGMTAMRLPHILSGGDTGALAGLPERDHLLLVNSGGVVYRSTNGGESWMRIARVNMDPNEECRHTGECMPKEVQAADSTHYFMVSTSELLYGTSDGGKHWKVLGDAVNMTDPAKHPFFVARRQGVFQHVPEQP